MVIMHFLADFGELLHLSLRNDLQRELHWLDGQGYAAEFMLTGFGLDRGRSVGSVNLAGCTAFWRNF
jgi:hypothetical protein